MRNTYLLVGFAILIAACSDADSGTTLFAHKPEKVPDTAYVAQLRLKGKEASNFCVQKKYNTDYCFLLHMGRHSGNTRFYIWDLKQQMAIDSGLVSHGCGMHSWGVDETAEEPAFSNAFESHLSSLGKYRIGKRGYSQWGIHVNYLLHGLDTTNNNALGRNIVLHSWNMVEDKETYPIGAPEGWGCPAVSNTFMYKLDTLLQSTTKPVLLWMFTD